VVLDPDTKVLTIEGDRVVETPDDGDDDLLGGGDADLGTTSAAGGAVGDAAAGGEANAGGDAARPRTDGGCDCLRGWGAAVLRAERLQVQ
jgi:hypothetical protein